VTRETSVIPPRPGRGPDKAAFGAAITFPREARILRRADFRLVYDHGIRVPSPLFAAFCLSVPEPPARAAARVGITVPRAVGKAVDRNRIKRRVREAFRLHRAALQPRWDIVLNPRRAALTAAFPELERAILKVMERCNSQPSQPQ
jgi:ribonuclease P protein component